MKHTLNKTQLFTVLALAIMFLPANGRAQSSGFGIGTVLGVGQATMHAPGLGTINPKIQFTAGATTCYKFNSFFGLGLDIVGTSKGGSYNGSENAGFPSQQYTFKETYTMVDLEVPLMAKFFIGNDNLSFNAMAGPSMNFNIIATSTRVYDDANRNSNYGYTAKNLNGINPTNFGYTYGVGLMARSGSNYYFVNLRRNGPLGPFGQLNGQNATHSGFNLTFGYLFY